MSTKRQKRIYAAYEAIELNEPDISTERLLSMTADHAKCDIGTVVDALYVVGKEKGTVVED